MPFMGGLACPPIWGNERKWTGFAIIPVYRDLRQFQKYKSGAVTNVRWPQKREVEAGFASALVNGLVPVIERETARREVGIAATSERPIGRGGLNRECTTPC